MNKKEPSVRLSLKNVDTFFQELTKLNLPINEGDIVNGTVIKIQNYGAFIALESTDKIGMIHISEVSNFYVKNINDFLSIGDKVRVKVLRVNIKENKIELSLKQNGIRNIQSSSSTVENKKEKDIQSIQKIPTKDSVHSDKKQSVTSKLQREKFSTENHGIIPKISTEKNKDTPVEKDDFGRVKNAENSPFRFVPRSVIRPLFHDEQNDSEKNDRKSTKAQLGKIVNLMSMGAISSFEIGLIYWIAKLRFSNKAMLTDLVRCSFIDRTLITTSNPSKKLKDKLDLLVNNDLINRLQIIQYTDSNIVENAGARIYILNQLGNTTLREIGFTDIKFNAFDIVLDANTAKKFLASNQWLIFMITHFPKNAIGENYETSSIFHLRSEEHSGARFFATVICNDEMLVGEAVRRVEDFEMHSHKNFIREKLERFIKIFENFKDIYIKRNNGGVDKFLIKKRPILVYICEDDEHVQEVEKNLHDIIVENPHQEIWFTTDLRIFNEEMKNQRFLKMTSNRDRMIIDLKKRLHVQEIKYSAEGTC